MHKMKIPTGKEYIKPKLGSIPDAQFNYNLGRGSIMRIAKEANALVRVGRLVKVDFERMDKYFDIVCTDK